MRITKGSLLLLQIHVLLNCIVYLFEEILVQSILPVAYFNVLRTILFVFSSPYKSEDLTELHFAKDCFTSEHS